MTACLASRAPARKTHGPGTSTGSNPEDEYADDEYADDDAEDRERRSAPAAIPDGEPGDDMPARTRPACPA
jgi:hypothetical protein